jgi:hypothetical protein
VTMRPDPIGRPDADGLRGGAAVLPAELRRPGPSNLENCAEF